MEDMKIQLDQLFDITKCRCPILTCSETDCPGCPSDRAALPPRHITCVCPKDQKIPVLEVSFIDIQRKKIGEKSGTMISNVDKKESMRQDSAIKRKIRAIEEEEKKKRKEEENTKYEKEAEVEINDFMNA